MRRNRILVNGHPVGTLFAETIDPGGEARFAVPEAAQANGPLWRITIQAPRAPEAGWDLRWAQLRPAAPSEPGQR